jgi:hypothetical protein
VRIGSPLEALEVTLVNSRFGIAAHGFGGLEAKVKPGLYELQFRAGSVEQTRLLKLEPGALFKELNVVMPVSSAAPLEGTTTTREPHQQAALEASRALGSADGVVVMLRNLRDENAPFNQGIRKRLCVVGPTLEELPGRWKVDSRSAVATFSSPARPGPVALRHRHQSGPKELYRYLPLWVVHGWQTLAFVPNTAEGPAPELATVHMARSGLGWEPWSENAHIGVALELALSGLRTGRPVVPRDLLNLLLNSKFQNPILGIVGAHALLGQPKLNNPLLETVLGNLERLLGPDHPDLSGLRWLHEEARARGRARKPPALRPIVWPPAFLASYQALLRLDALRPRTLAIDSTAERAAATIEVSGVWTSWTAPRTSSEAAMRAAAQARVAEYIRGVATLHNIADKQALARINEQQTALAVGLPVNVVLKALSDYRTT